MANTSRHKKPVVVTDHTRLTNCADMPLVWHWHGSKPYHMRCKFDAMAMGVSTSESMCHVNLKLWLDRNPCTLVGYVQMLEVWEWWERGLPEGE